MMKIYLLSFFVAVGVSSFISVEAALSPPAESSNKAVEQKRTSLPQKKSFIGGTSGTGFAIKEVRLQKPKAKVGGRERIIFDMVDVKGQPIQGNPPYHHVEIKTNPQRIVIDLPQTSMSFFDEAELSKQLRNSGKVLQSRMVLDPYDQGLMIEIILKEKVKVRPLQVVGQKSTARIVMELQ